jgi:5-formyltetrahydrofolate cyclo-ligase
VGAHSVFESSAIIAAKRQLRESAKRVRAEAFRQQGTDAAAKIASHGIAFADPRPGATVSGFSAIGEELDPMPLMLRLDELGHDLALPVMQGKAKPLLFRRWQPGDAMAAKTWGILEPLPSAPLAEPDVILVALLAFDARGYRLGYGGGFFDRTIAAARSNRKIIAIGLAYDEQEVEEVPHLAYDERLDWVLTPSGPRKCLDT